MKERTPQSRPQSRFRLKMSEWGDVTFVWLFIEPHSNVAWQSCAQTAVAESFATPDKNVRFVAFYFSFRLAGRRPGEQVPQPPELVSDGLGDSTATVSTDGLTEVARTDLVSDGLGDSTATVS